MLLLLSAYAAPTFSRAPAPVPLPAAYCAAPVDQYFHGFALGDPDQDGTADLMVSQHMGPPALLHWSAVNQRFESDWVESLGYEGPDCAGSNITSYLLRGDVHQPAFADLDGDGADDLYLPTGALNASCCGANQALVWQGSTDFPSWGPVGFGDFNELTASTRYGLPIDYDLDGDIDLFTGHAVCVAGSDEWCDPSNHTHRLWRNERYAIADYGDVVYFVDESDALDETWSPTDDNTGAGIVTDLDDNGFPDLLLTGTWAKIGDEVAQPVRYHLHDGGDAFDRYACGSDTEGVVGEAVGDVDLDGIADIAYGFEGGEVYLLLSARAPVDPCDLGTATLLVTADGSVSGVSFGDFDNDGYVDLVYARTGATRTASLVACRGDGTTITGDCSTASLVNRLSLGHVSLLPLDPDGDRVRDLLVAGDGPRDSAPYLWRNTTASVGGGLEVRLAGGPPFGARVAAYVVGTADLVQATWSQAGGSYLASQSPWVHLGVGTAAEVDLYVRWPDTGVDTLVGTVTAGECVVVDVSGAISTC